MATVKYCLEIASIFLLGSEQNLISQDVHEQEVKTDETVRKLGMPSENKILIRKEEDLHGIDKDRMDVLVVFPCCRDRFSSLIQLAENGLPMIVVGDGEAFADALDTYSYLADHSNVELVLTAEEVKTKLRALETAKWVKNAKVCVLGLEDPTPELAAWYRNPMGLGKLNIIRVSKEKVAGMFKNADKGLAENIAKKWVSECAVKEPLFEDIVLSARVYLALKNVIEETKSEAAYVPWCGQFTQGLQTKMCFAIAKVADDGIPIGCYKGENLLPMLILHATAYKPVFVCEANGRQGSTIELRHCFSPTALSSCKPVLRPWRSLEHTVTAHCQLPKGEVTLVNCGIGDKILITKAQVTDCKDLEGDNCRITIYVELESEQTLHKLVSREFALVYGDYTREVTEVAKKLGLEIL